MEGPQGLHVHDNYMHAQCCGHHFRSYPSVPVCPFVSRTMHCPCMVGVWCMEGPQGLHIHDNYMHAQYCGPPLSDSPHCVSGCPFVFMDHTLGMYSNSRRVVYGRSPVPSHTCHTYACTMLWSPNPTFHPLCFMIVHLFSQTRHCPCIVVWCMERQLSLHIHHTSMHVQCYSHSTTHTHTPPPPPPLLPLPST